MRFGWRWVLVAAVALAALGCTSPTLPLPPPSAPSEQLGGGANEIILTGTGAIPNALIVVENDDTSLSGQKIAEATLADATGTWTLTILAKKGDVLRIIQLAGDETSSIDFTVMIN